MKFEYVVEVVTSNNKHFFTPYLTYEAAKNDMDWNYNYMNSVEKVILYHNDKVFLERCFKRS